MSAGTGGERAGVISAFDEHRGLGTITPTGDDEASFQMPSEVPFHCTQIADGTRTIAVGTAVTFELLPRLGRWEATAIRPRT